MNKNSFTIIPDWVIDLEFMSSTDLVVYKYLKKGYNFAMSQGKDYQISYSILSDGMKKDVRVIKRSIKRMEEHGILCIERGTREDNRCCKNIIRFCDEKPMVTDLSLPTSGMVTDLSLSPSAMVTDLSLPMVTDLSLPPHDVNPYSDVPEWLENEGLDEDFQEVYLTYGMVTDLSPHTKETYTKEINKEKNKKEKKIKKEKEMNEFFETSGTSSKEENWLNDFIVNYEIEQEVPVKQESGGIFDDFDLIFDSTESKASDIPPHVLHQLEKIIKFKANRKLQGFRPIRCLNDFNEAADILLKEALLHVPEDEWRSYLINEVDNAKEAFAKEWTAANLSQSDMYRPTVNRDYEAYAKVTF